MRIRAIRLAECGRFEGAVAVEGLSGGLDVLIGPNEAGKSTLLRALRLALTEKRTSAKSDIKELRPYRGGAPLVEVDLEVAGRLWRLRKRFLAERTAELTELATGRIARGADAETELEALLAEGGGAGRLALLWLDQGSLIEDMRPDMAGEDVVRAAIDREIANAAGGEGLRRLRAKVLQRLEEHVSLKQARKRGRFEAAEIESGRAAARLAEARVRHAEAEDQLDRLAAVVAQAEAMAAPAEAAQRERRLEEAETRLREARTGLAAREAQRTAAAEARAQHERAATAAKAQADGLAALATHDRLEAEDAAHARHIAAALGEAAARLAEAERRVAAGQAALEAGEARADEARAAARWRELERRLAEASAADAAAAAAQTALAAAPVDEKLVGEARRLSAEIAAATARLEAQSAVVTIAYSLGGEGRIRLDGALLADGARVVADRPLALDIVGVGRITIAPRRSEDEAALEAGLDRGRKRLNAILAAAGARDLADLEAAWGRARAQAAALGEARSRLAALAPEGLARLQAEHDRLAAMLDGRVRGGPAAGDEPASPAIDDPVAIEAEVQRLRAEARNAGQHLAAAREGHARLAREEAGRAARAGERQAQRASLEAALPAPGERQARSAALAALAGEASATYDEALRALRAWDRSLPDAAGLARLEAEVAVARGAIRRAEQEVAALVSERSRLEGSLEAARRENAACELARAEAEAARASETLADLTEEVAALRLLDGLLAHEVERLAASYQAPVTARLEPYLGLVFPGASLALGPAFRAEGLTRAGAPEDITRLSAGTREQLAVLVRLGLARLLADQGAAAPLILDDALVYSDDDRIRAMHSALERAAEAHQVIVLSCRTQALAGLGGHRLTLAPWQAA